MKKSTGVSITGTGSPETVFTVPNGYKAYVTMFFLTNVGGSTTTVSASWHDGATVPFLGSKSLSSGDYVQFGGGEGLYMAMEQGDYITVTVASGDSCGLIISYDLVRTDSQG